MSYSRDREKYSEFFDSYNPNRSKTKRNARPPKKKRRLKPSVKYGAIVLIIAILFIIVFSMFGDEPDKTASASDNHSTVSGSQSTISNETASATASNQQPVDKSHTIVLGNEIESSHAILIDTSDNTILARKKAETKLYPASMTKIMTLLVVAENIDDIGAKFKMTSKIIDPLYNRDATLAGFAPGEEVSIEDMIYGMILESGAEASVGLAIHIAGSEEEFVKLMNKKCDELGLKGTHFCNVSGLYDKNHYSTSMDMAIIMREVINNDFCKQVISTEYYTVDKNKYHDELKFHSGMFEKMFGTEPEVATVKGGKTGFTNQSLFCLVSYAVTDDGRTLICVTTNGETKYTPIYDHIKMYKSYSHPKKSAV